MTSPLKQMLQNTVDLIHSQGFDRSYGEVRVRPRGTVGREVDYWEVTWTPTRGSHGYPDQVTLKFDGMFSLGQLATHASTILRKMVR